MAKYVCAMCGNTLGMMESINREFPDDGKGRGLCLKCHQYFTKNVAGRLEAVNGPREFKMVQESVLDQVKTEKGTAGYEYVKDFFKYKEKEFASGGENGRWEICPVCRDARDPQDDVCPTCGYLYSDRKVLSREDYIRAAEGRYEQYQKNPLYEYKVEIIVDSALTGTVRKEELQRMLSVYAMDGWRLHTALTNEAGKTVLAAAGVGANATVDQTVLIFERCIKSREN
ncbi:DUF4177 domain-containing protein [[Clostridium] hylemonae]|uniref:DUF4177 domain-containing protein n=1 Tax=[Clostridium] hylemonae TaxID=89153 RepID=UPI001FCC6FFA|nr:DUF4177 domain-containing protein [[Clostridium] hylemonae]BDF06004.1 hypothetical protein CE91St63_30660 [[Clostridium] hylemonae]